MKEYIKPELEVISLVADEAITGDVTVEIGGISGMPGVEDNPFG